MKKQLSLLAITILLLSGCQYFGQKPANTIPPIGSENGTTATTVTVTDPKNSLPSTDSRDQTATTDNSVFTGPQYSIYMIAIGDKGLNGKEVVGCGDSVVPLVQNSTLSTASNSELLNEAFTNLLSIKDKTLPQSAFSNFLADSKLKLVSAEIKDGKAIIKLAGEISQTGTCQFPRAKAQLEETAGQFDEAKSVEIYLNNKPLKQGPKVKG